MSHSTLSDALAAVLLVSVVVTLINVATRIGTPVPERSLGISLTVDGAHTSFRIEN